MTNTFNYDSLILHLKPERSTTLCWAASHHTAVFATAQP